MVENLLNEARVYRMPRAFGDQMPDKGDAEQRKIPDQIENFVPHEFIGKTKT